MKSDEAITVISRYQLDTHTQRATFDAKIITQKIFKV